MKKKRIAVIIDNGEGSASPYQYRGKLGSIHCYILSPILLQLTRAALPAKKSFSLISPIVADLTTNRDRTPQRLELGKLPKRLLRTGPCAIRPSCFSPSRSGRGNATVSSPAEDLRTCVCAAQPSRHGAVSFSAYIASDARASIRSII